MITTTTGFAGGHVANPTYQQVCTKTTGHAEVVRVVYDLRRLPTATLLRTFFTLHDFTKDRTRKGGQYRSAIYTEAGSPHAAEQTRVIKRTLEKLRAAGYQPATETRSVKHFYPASSRHQQYCSARGLTPKKHQMADVSEILT